jgi:hypothetical protein
MLSVSDPQWVWYGTLVCHFMVSGVPRIFYYKLYLTIADLGGRARSKA